MALLQSKTSTNPNPLAGAVATGTWTSNTQSGSLVVLGIINDSGLLNEVSSVTDSQGNTYTRITSTLGITIDVELWYAKNITGGITPTVSATMGNTNIGVILFMREYSAMDPSAPLDKSAAASGLLSTAISSGATAATTQAQELVVGLGGSDNRSNTYTVGAGYGNLIQTTLANTGDGAMEDKVVSATGAQTATFTLNTSANWIGAVATFKFIPYIEATTSDSSTVTDTIPSHYSDQVDVVESYKATLTSFINPTADTATITDSPQVLIPELLINKSDTITITESVTVDLGPYVTDNITVTESAQVFIPELVINKSDTVTITESTIIDRLFLINIPETVTITESLQELVSPLVQVATATSTTTSVTASFATTPIEGDLMVALVFANKTGSVVAISGWTLANSQDFSTPLSASLFFKAAASSESTDVTATATAASIMEIQIAEYSLPYTLLEKTTSTADSGVNVTQRSTGTTAATTKKDELIVAAMGFSANQGGGLAWTNSYTGRATTPRLALSDKTANSAGTFETAATWTTGVHAVGLIATFETALTVNKSDTITITESKAAKLEHNINVFDDITIDDDTVIPDLTITKLVSDNITISEFWEVSIGGTREVDVFDDITASESRLVNLAITAAMIDRRILDSNDEPITDSTGDWIFDSYPQGEIIRLTENVGHYSDQVDIMERVQIQIEIASPLSVSDTATITESFTSYSDQADVMEYVSVAIVAPPLEIGLGDTINSSESWQVVLGDLLVGISDTITITEFKDILVFTTTPSRDIRLTDTRILDETGDPLLDEDGNFIFDEDPSGEYIYTTESVAASIKTDFFINKSDTITITENLSVVLQPLTYTPSVSDNVTVSENVSVFVTPLYVNVSELISSAEITAVQVATTFAVNVFDASAIIIESVQVLITELFITKSDSVTISETVQTNPESFISTSDNISLSESTTALNANLFVNVSDTVTIDERFFFAGIPLDLSVSDSITTTEFIRIFIRRGHGHRIIISSEEDSGTLSTDDMITTVSTEDDDLIITTTETEATIED